MYYEVKYLFRFESSNGTTREIRVLHKEAGDRSRLVSSNDYFLTEHDGLYLVVRSYQANQRAQGRAPVIKKQKNGPIHGTSLTFYAECQVDGEFIEFYTSDPKEYRVDVYDGSTLLWQGFITPELYSEPDIAPPYDVQVVATDGLGELKLYDFAPQGTVSLRAMLAYLLDYTGLSTDVNLVSSLCPGSNGAGELLDMTINLDYMEGKTCYEVLTYLLDTLHATITRWGGAWLLTRETNVTYTNGKVDYYNTSGSAAQLDGSVAALGKMYSNLAWPVGQLSMVINPARNKVTVQAPWHQVTCLANPEMSSDTGWTKSNNAAYSSDGYLLPNNDPGSGTYSTAMISQQVSMGGLRSPMSCRITASGVSSEVGGRITGAVVGILLTYTVGTSVYHLRRNNEGYPEWQLGSAVGSDIPGDDIDYQKPLSSWDSPRIGAEELAIEDIPAFVSGTSFPSGTLSIYIAGYCVRVYTAQLEVSLPKGYQDILRLDNGARGAADDVEIAIGRETSDTDYYKQFLQGILLDSGDVITSFADANFTTGMDYLAFISRDYALSVALPRVSIQGTVYLEDSIVMPPLVFAKGGLNYWLQTWAWNLYEDELEIEALTLPSAALTVQSETILESDESKV